ncbi:hypothetical protein [Pontibacter mangrovi]|uniref:Uncharacterized protein n=1 Tax=Pontibacter mangrovi TaxID=2589816 RepID=A0A501WGG5_9BACT|nr:hypothetical protein [Pontibacter mangrovi]TPE46251.1 hypothetical protein FJM65_02595 [Pontibacter mangrovi]
MKHYLKIWSLLMLVTHLFFLAFISFVPGEGAGVTFRKECLREKALAAKVAAAAHKEVSVLTLFGDTGQEHKKEIKVCSVKLFCTAATEAHVSLAPPLVLKSISSSYKAYHSLSASCDPDPPKHC